MSKITAVICELNPLHIGHKYVFEKAREYGETVVAVMSGNFVQRGECAIFDKYTRARAALLSGADLVLELPFPWCAAPAEFFARGAMAVVKAVGADCLVFGSECGDTELLVKGASLSRSEAFLAAVETEYTENVGYAAAREKAAKKLMPEAAELFSGANDMLAMEYFVSAEKLGFDGSLNGVKRIKTDDYVSASEIRCALRSGNAQGVIHAIPDEEKALFEEALSDMGSLSKLEETQFSAFRQRQIKNGTFDYESGIVSRLEKCADAATSGREMLEKASTKKYTDARIKRAALFALCGVTKEALQEPPCFTVVLGANEKGRAILSDIRKNEDLRVITKPSDITKVKGGEKNAEADRLYTMLMDEVKDAGFFMKQSPVII
ncbi:MAG: nucleotidyltransferase family protein [Ruminococcaceae bacterium]|nr:nucleotidyltransferase family protein [Oscillospiraceae bacterium]